MHDLACAVAPDGQAWVGIVGGCLREQRESTLSHDNLFHSMLGLMGVRSAVYRAELDLSGPCAGPGQVAAVEEPTAAHDSLRSAP